MKTKTAAGGAALLTRLVNATARAEAAAEEARRAKAAFRAWARAAPGARVEVAVNGMRYEVTAHGGPLYAVRRGPYTRPPGCCDELVMEQEADALAVVGYLLAEAGRDRCRWCGAAGVARGGACPACVEG